MKCAARLGCLLLTVCCVSATYADSFGSGANSFDIEFVSIGNPGNVNDDNTGGYFSPYLIGSIPYSYRIGKFEVSRDMVAKANNAGAVRITLFDSYGFDTGGNQPATGISWNEAARFVNWLNTSTGNSPAYKFAIQPNEPGYNSNANILLWAPSDPGYDPNNLYRNSLARYFLPNVDEWYKAAFYDPSRGIYYNYSTGSDSTPTAVVSGTAAGTAVYGQIGQYLGPADITLAGGLSPYGTMGQGGNVSEWEETDYDVVNGPHSPSLSSRGLRMYSWTSIADSLHASIRPSLRPYWESSNNGFRVASIPEPSTLIIGAMASFAFLFHRRTRYC